MATPPYDQQAANRLIKLYQTTYNNILSEIDKATDFGKFYRVQTLAYIDQELKRLGAETTAWIQKEIPAAYKAGMKEAIDNMHKQLVSNPFYHGGGGGAGTYGGLGGDIFGSGFYITPNKKTAKLFGDKVDKVYLSLYNKAEILRINTDADYDKLIHRVIKAYPGEDYHTAIPKWAKVNGYKAIAGADGFDDKAGIAVFDKTLVSKTPTLPIRTLFTTQNRQMVEALVDDTSKRFAEAISGVGRSTRNLTNIAFQREVRAKIAEGVITGATRPQIVQSVKGLIREQGLTALKDRAGRTWTIDRYSSMLVRTKMAEARNTGLVNKMLENKQDLVQVSQNRSTHEACRIWEGRILTMTGATDGYPSYEEAVSTGLFHPNCKHTVNPINPELAALNHGWDTTKKGYYHYDFNKDKLPKGKYDTWTQQAVKSGALSDKLAQQGYHVTKDFDVLDPKGKVLTTGELQFLQQNKALTAAEKSIAQGKMSYTQAEQLTTNLHKNAANAAQRPFTSRVIDNQANLFQQGKISEQQFKGFVIDDFQSRYKRNPSEADIMGLMATYSGKTGKNPLVEQLRQRTNAAFGR
jgi:hypothetical protein